MENVVVKTVDHVVERGQQVIARGTYHQTVMDGGLGFAYGYAKQIVEGGERWAYEDATQTVNGGVGNGPLPLTHDTKAELCLQIQILHSFITRFLEFQLSGDLTTEAMKLSKDYGFGTEEGGDD